MIKSKVRHSANSSQRHVDLFNRVLAGTKAKKHPPLFTSAKVLDGLGEASANDIWKAISEKINNITTCIVCSD